MVVDILVTVSGDEGQVKAGSIWLEDGKLRFTAKPKYEQLMQNLVGDDEIVADDEGRDLSPKTTPEEWFKKLPVLYSGSYLRACMDDREPPQ
jgi:hypothetical protein